MHILENNFLQIAIHPKGAELQRLYNKETKTDYLWSGNDSYWGKFSPVLFPIVGTLKDNTYFYNNKSYTLPRHGFARDSAFILKEKTDNSISFLLQEDTETLKFYPFPFSLTITYTLNENSLSCNYKVENSGTTEMLFSIGAHPAFAVPFIPNTTYEDYYLEFPKDEQLTRWKLTDGGLIGDATEKIELYNNKLPLQHKLFEDDAIVIKDLKSNRIKLTSTKSENGFTFSWNNFPFFGIWSAKKAPFVCLEPWQGIADSSNHNQQLEDKEGIISLAQNANWQGSWSVACF